MLIALASVIFFLWSTGGMPDHKTTGWNIVVVGLAPLRKSGELLSGKVIRTGLDLF